MENILQYDLDFNRQISINVKKLIKEHKTSNLVLCALLEIKPAAITELLSARSNWLIKHVIKIAMYYSVPIDKIVFGDEGFIKKNQKRTIMEAKRKIHDYLVREKRTSTYGRLKMEGFFDDLEKKNN